MARGGSKGRSYTRDARGRFSSAGSASSGGGKSGRGIGGRVAKIAKAAKSALSGLLRKNSKPEVTAPSKGGRGRLVRTPLPKMSEQVQRQERSLTKARRLNKEIRAEKAALKKVGAKGSSLLTELQAQAATVRRNLEYERDLSSGAGPASAKKGKAKGGKASAPAKPKAGKKAAKPKAKPKAKASKKPRPMR